MWLKTFFHHSNIPIAQVAYLDFGKEVRSSVAHGQRCGRKDQRAARLTY